MEDRHIAPFIDSVSAHLARGLMKPAEKERLKDSARELISEGELIQKQLSLLDLDEFKDWKQALKARFEKEAARIVVSTTLDPYQAGRSFGKMTLLAELDSDSRKLERRLEVIRDELSKIETKLNPETDS